MGRSVKSVVSFGPMGLRLLPVQKHNCYQNALEHVVENRDWMLVHGVCLGTGEQNLGQAFGHAWLEKELVPGLMMCYDPTHSMMVSAKTYYAAGMIGYTVRYSVQEAGRLYLRHNHFGPWDAKISEAAHHD